MGEIPLGVRRQSEILMAQARCTAAGMPRLRTLDDLPSYWVEINRLENDADGVYRTMIADLFATAPDPLELIKVKDVASALESAADAFEQVAHHVESIAVKES
jgi:uncharacterized protein Yka (UPF0111/DUF47 family)